MIPSFAGVALLAPNLLALGGATLVIVALELQTRLVEEPYLSMVHGERSAYMRHEPVASFQELAGHGSPARAK